LHIVERARIRFCSQEENTPPRRRRNKNCKHHSGQRRAEPSEKRREISRFFLPVLLYRRTKQTGLIEQQPFGERQRGNKRRKESSLSLTHFFCLAGERMEPELNHFYFV
jgi:hypothetical protein